MNDVAEDLKIALVKKEESRKKIVQFGTHCITERNNLQHTVSDIRKLYEQKCDIANNSAAKYQKATDEKGKAKLRRIWHVIVFVLTYRKIF
jgi:CRISPR/Cas system CSM-associated protein Csm2 small subunit